MKIYYDKDFAKWYCINLEDPVTIGGENKLIEQGKASLDSFCFDVCLSDNHVGPLIGIMTSRSKNGVIAGNGPLFKELQKKLISLAGISFIFTMEGVGNDTITGYIFLPDKQMWIKVQAPYPDLIYNRIPFRKAEQDPHLPNFLSALKEKNIPYFNPSFINKMELYCLLKNYTSLKKHLPDTILANKERDLLSFLIKHKFVYLKPSQASKGKGIFRVHLNDNMEVKLEGLKMTEAYPSFHHFWKEWEKTLKDKSYLAQKEIKAAVYEGKRYDFRILAHAANDGYMVTGVGIRQSQLQEITTHIPNGGKLLPYQLFQTDKHDFFFQTIVSQIGKALTEHFDYFGEFSIDAGIDESGHYYIYEVNSKPMSFDETEIEEKRIEQLCRLFFQLTGFPI
jgi:hypothetical protein